MRKKLWFLILLAIVIIFVGCSQENTADYAEQDSGAIGSEPKPGFDYDGNTGESDDLANNRDVSREDLEEANRKIIYNAYLDLEVKQYLNVIETIEETIEDMDGYIVSNQTSRLDSQLHRGNITLRIPQKSLNSFFDFLEGSENVNIEHREVTGEDVTEQYVDLETRLHSREQLEERLLEFMEDAETTEDLLNISRDLANVQYEIERIKGQMNYIDNRSDLATVELSIIERETEFAHDQSLDVWDRTKDQWLKSYNQLLIGAANAFVFVVGNLPIIVIIFLIGALIYWAYRKQRDKNNTHSN